MLVDCDSCVVRGAACRGCVVSVMLDPSPGGVELDDEERRAIAVLADAGLVPRLRLVTALDVVRPAAAADEGWIIGDERWALTDEGRAVADTVVPRQETIPGTTPGPVAGRPARRDPASGRRGAAGGRVRHIA